MAIDKEFLAKGTRGVTYITSLDGERVVVKEERRDSEAVGALKNEYNFLQELNKHGIGPKVKSFEDGKLYMELVQGQPIEAFLEKSDKEKVKKVLKKVFDKLKKMDELGIDKKEMTHPQKHIIVGDEPVMIDFEKCRYTENPQNVTQFAQYMTNIKDLLEKKGFEINKEEIFKKAQEYKNTYSKKSYKALLEEVGL